MDPTSLQTLLGLAVLLPLASFFAILMFANRLGKSAAYVAVSAIGGACLLSFVAMFVWLGSNWPEGVHHGDHAAGHGEVHHGEDDHAPHSEHDPAPHGEGHEPKKSDGSSEKHSDAEKKAGDGAAAEKHTQYRGVPGPDFVALVQDAPATTDEAHPPAAPARSPAADHPPATGESSSEDSAATAEHPPAEGAFPRGPYTGEYYTFGVFGPLRVTISYYIDALTVAMFCMVTLIATLIHLYAMGYMSDELSDVTDHEVTTSDGHHLHRPGRFPRFFQALSLFCFSMLGLVLSGNIAMVFIFWELVGICSYFLIGFYIERKSASTAANKAFIVNRVGDFGMIIGLLAIWSSLGTFAFGDIERPGPDGTTISEPGIFSLVRPGPEHALIVPASMVVSDRGDEVAAIYRDHRALEGGNAAAASEVAARVDTWRTEGAGYWLLVVAGVGIFCGCVGKSAQFPLHVWLPDAMEGPTPVSALVHSATMVAAGVYLVGRFFPVFLPEVLTVIASIGCITMLLGATIAFTAVDIKRVLAYSTVSQLGLMMLALGVGGWVAGLMHLVTHAFFKSMLFMCSGSVIHAVHTNDMRLMGGLYKKMPVTALTMLIGCLAIAGVAVPFVVGFSGHYSKDAILEQAMSFWRVNGSAWSGIYFVLALAGAAMTTTYMFRMWFMTFVGEPRDPERYSHAHESPPVMVLPLVVLAVLATSVAWDFSYLGYFLIAGGFFLVRGVQQGWFKGSSHDGHGHGDHGHGPSDHGHDGHGDHGHGAAHHDDHGHGAHGHDNHAEPASPPLTWAWAGTMLLATIVGGLAIQRLVLQPTLASSPAMSLNLMGLLEDARPAGTLKPMTGQWLAWTWPNEHDSHADAIKIPVTLMATGTWVAGILLAASLYWWGYMNPADVRRQFAPIYTILWNKYYFDELYQALFVQPTMVLARVASSIDKSWLDGFIDFLAKATIWFSDAFEAVADRTIVDGLVNLFAGWTYSLGTSLRAVQTGRLRQYVMFIVVGAIAIFVLISFFWSPTLAR
jgi:NADH:ubiquinone oxidoreductase subunit 5 (subunit L)/multisubunit Na+/H+ antiporter MnhA subunit